MKKWLCCLLVTLVFTETWEAAMAAPKSQTVYIKYPKTPFRSDTSLNAKVETLDAGQEVVWQGADEKQPQWQKVQYAGEMGFVALSNLSKRPPAKELVVAANGSVESQDTQSFAKSSAAAKALGPGATTYAEAKDQGEVAIQVYIAELISKHIRRPEDLNAHAKQAGLTEHHGGAR